MKGRKSRKDRGKEMMGGNENEEEERRWSCDMDRLVAQVSSVQSSSVSVQVGGFAPWPEKCTPP